MATMNLPADAKRGDLFQFDGNEVRSITGATNGQLVAFDSTTGLWKLALGGAANGQVPVWNSTSGSWGLGPSAGWTTLSKAANYAIAAADVGQNLYMPVTSAATITMPPPATTKGLILIKSGGGVATIAANAGESFFSPDGRTLASVVLSRSFVHALMFSNGSNWILVNQPPRPKSFLITADLFKLALGAPTFVAAGGALGWPSVLDYWVLHAASADGLATGLIRLPDDWESGTVKFSVVWWDTSAFTTQTNHFDLAALAMTPGTTSPEAAFSFLPTAITPAVVSAALAESAFAGGLTVAAGQYIRVAIDRNGPAADDSSPFDIKFGGILLTYTADD